MSLPAIAIRTASFALTLAISWLAYPLLAAVVYLGFLIVAAFGDMGLGGPLAGPVLVLLAALAGAICVAVAAPAAIAVRAVRGIKGILAGAAVLVFLAGGTTGLAWVLFDLSGHPLVGGAVLVAAATPAVLVLTLSEVVARLVADRVTHLPGRAGARTAVIEG
ncbi:hypothetical protein ACIA03_26980 [Nocardioides sp. NPDC051685]|uniref:hypothetical protein n=1 Tax=Nocardioides sp. NPDC051685 TaxID=3364334 RepID=UPI0037BA3209